jgi:ectoine hydroxylase-related dioxygenase (phytanoyl-CoA dioxygenase family)
MIKTLDWKNKLDSEGFVILENVVASETIIRMREALDQLPRSRATLIRGNAIYGVRNLTTLSAEVRQFAKSEAVRSIVEQFLEPTAFLARSIYFDKSPEANWKVPWHQDLTIVVSDRVDEVGFGPWTKKAGKWHVQPPVEVLEKMVTLRFHLDPATVDNGPLRVSSGSHRRGRLSPNEIQATVANGTTVCCVKQGDCIVMRPLLLHASSAGVLPSRRRVVHLEFASESLPGLMKWNGS